MRPALSILFSLLLLSTAHGEEAVEDWMTYYYKKPTPELVVPRVRELASQGLLKDEHAHPPIIAFLSLVMAQNHTQVGTWLKELGDLKESEHDVVLAAAWYSDTEEARAHFKAIGREEFLQEKAPKILEQPLDNPSALDMLWGYFLATGDQKPIRRLVSALDLAKYTGAEQLKYDRDSEEAQKALLLNVTFKAAVWSLESNCRQHPVVLEHCEKLFAEKDLPEVQKRWLGAILGKVKPEIYGPEANKKKI